MKKVKVITGAIYLLLCLSVATPAFAQTYTTSQMTSLIDSIRQALNALSTIGVGGSYTGQSGTGNQTSSSGFPKTVSVNINFLRILSTPDTAGGVIGSLTKNQSFVATSQVSGESVHGESRWWARQGGGYVWSGGTNQGSSAGGTGSTGTGSGSGGNTGGAGGSTTTGPTPGTGSGNCSIVGSPLSDGMSVVAVVGNLNNAVPVTDGKVTAGASVYMFSPLVETYDGWAKVSVNGVDYPVAGPGTPPVGSLPYSTSGQNHTALNRFDIIVPNLPVPDGSDMTIKLYRMNGDQTPYVVKKTFRYYSSLTPTPSDPFILPNASLGQNYSAPLTAKCGGNVAWQYSPILAGVLPKGFNITNSNLVYNPIGNYVTPQVGDVGIFLLLGKSGSNDVVQKFSMSVVYPSSATGSVNTGGGTTSNNTTQSSGFPTVSSISPNYSNIVGLYAGKTITISGQNLNSGSVRVDFYQGTAYRGSASSVSALSSSSIQAVVPPTLSVGAYTVQVTIGNTVATSIDPSIRTFTVSP